MRWLHLSHACVSSSIAQGLWQARRYPTEGTARVSSNQGRNVRHRGIYQGGVVFGKDERSCHQRSLCLREVHARNDEGGHGRREIRSNALQVPVRPQAEGTDGLRHHVDRCLRRGAKVRPPPKAHGNDFDAGESNKHRRQWPDGTRLHARCAAQA